MTYSNKANKKTDITKIFILFSSRNVLLNKLTEKDCFVLIIATDEI